MRSFLTMLGVIIGVFALATVATFMPKNDAKGTSKRFTTSRITVQDAEAFKEIDGITGVSGFATVSLQVVRGTNNKSVLPYGVQPDYFRFKGYIPEEGRIFSGMDDLRQEKVCVIGHDIVKDFFEEDEEIIRNTLRLGTRNFIVVGMLPEKNPIIDDMVFVPLSTMLHRLNGTRFL